MDIPYYIKIGRASDLKDPKERAIFRFFEILPGAISWATLILIFLLSWLKPLWMAIAITLFVTFWLFRSIYFSFYLRSCYNQMRKSERTDWLEKLNQSGKKWEDIYQLVVLPMHKEPYQLINESINSLLRSDWPKERMIIVLTCEENGNTEAARHIEKEFGGMFFKFLLTFHPQGLPNEIAGKGSNESWGVKEVKESFIDKNNIPYENVIVSSFDVDTVVFPKYFSCLAYHYLTVDNPTHCSFQPIPIFTNNIWQASPISRIFAFSASFWEMICQERAEKMITFSSHSMSFKALVDVGFRQQNIVSDDSRIFWQCFLRYDGDYRVVPLYYPISMDANCGPTFWTTVRNVYLQQKRWAYGVGDIPYFLFGFLKNKKIPFSKKFSLGWLSFEGHWAWATSSLLIFLLGWLPLVLGGSHFNQTLMAYNLPILVSRIMTVTMMGLIASAYFSILLLPPKPPEYGKNKYVFFVLEWALLPIIMIFFTSLPALDAQTRWMFGKYLGFWATPKTREKV